MNASSGITQGRHAGARRTAADQAAIRRTSKSEGLPRGQYLHKCGIAQSAHELWHNCAKLYMHKVENIRL